jgi:hypothetical protein
VVGEFSYRGAFVTFVTRLWPDRFARLTRRFAQNGVTNVTDRVSDWF